jgi:hypothetical protein
VPVVHRGDPRVAERPHEADAAARGGFLWTHRCKPEEGAVVQARFLKRQLSLPVSTMSQW